MAGRDDPSRHPPASVPIGLETYGARHRCDHRRRRPSRCSLRLAAPAPQHPCLILDQAAFPRGKPCAGWITPEVFQYLECTPEEYPFSLATFNTFQISLRGIRFQLPTLQYAIRRIEFDAWLLKRSGAEVLQHNVDRIVWEDNRYQVDDLFSARFIIGAGGTHCPVRRNLFSQGPHADRDVLIIAKEEEFPYPITDERCHL